MTKSKRHGRNALLTASLAIGPWLMPCAHAELGGAPVSFANVATVHTVQRTLAAAGGSVANAADATANAAGSGTPAYTVRETTLSSGTVVREYLAPNGQVFGAAWQGPVQPRLDQVLGSANFSTYASGVAAAHAAHGVRAPVSIDDAKLVVHVGGHMRAYFGQAWLPQALPAGVTGADIH